MKNFTAQLAPLSSDSQNWDNNTGKLKQLFRSITGYDIMFEESREDLMPAGNTVSSTQSNAALSALLHNSITKISYIIRARMM